MSVLADILDRVRAARTGSPLMVFDLDSTLFSTQQRNHAILREFATAVGAPDDFLLIAEKISPADLGWNVMEDLRSRGFRHEPTLSRLRSFWGTRFFRGEYLRHDRPLPGAVEYVNDAHAAGALIYYLTGRDEPGMGRGTRASLRASGFPLDDDRVRLRLKPRSQDDDLDFKRAAVEELRALGAVVAAFENEPANANLFAESFPEAQVVFLETVCHPNPPPLRPEVARVRDFRRSEPSPLCP
jgi:hypothetical protein